MDCKYRSSDHHSGAEEGSTKRSKATIVDFARKALLDLNTSMKEMKSWESQRSIFTSTICNQNEKIRCLTENNDSLTTDVKNLKSYLADAEESNTRIKFEDKKIDALVVGSASKIIRTIGDLSSELVSVHDTVNVFRDRNEHLRIKTDKLRAMVRVSSGNCQDFRNRVDELNNFTLRIDEEILALKSSLENLGLDGSLEMYKERTTNVAALMGELELKLKNDRDALFAGGNSYWSEYLRRIAKLEDSSVDLLRQLEVTKSEMRARSCGIESPHLTEHQKRLVELEELVKRVASDLKSLKTEPMTIGCRVGGESCTEYSKRIRTLWKLVATSKSIINKLIIESKEGFEESPKRYDRVLSTGNANIGALEVLAKKIKSGVKQLEIAVASGDNAKLIEKIRQLENSVERLRSEVAAKEEENSSIDLELTGAKIAFGEKVEALEKLRAKYEKMANRMKSRKHRNAAEDEQRIENLVRELERTKLEAQDSKMLRDELDELRRFAENFEKEKATLHEELRRNQVDIENRENQVLRISKEKSSIERTLTKERNEIERKLIRAVEEIKCLKTEILKLKETIVSTPNEGQNTSLAANKVELKRLQALLEETNESLGSKTEECANLQSKCNEVINEKTKMELELSRVKIQNDALIDHLNSERVTTAETLKDHQRLMADFRLQETDLQSLRMELSTLKKCLEEAERERDALRAEVTELRQGSVTLRDEALSLKSKANALTQELEEANIRRAETEAGLKKLEAERSQQCIRMDFLMKENDRLNEQLDRARSDKLDIAGTMNDWRLQCEETRTLLDSKSEEARSLNERLRLVQRDNETLKTREAATRLEVATSLEANAELRGAIDALSADKTRLEEQLGALNNECQALGSRLEALQGDNDALREASSALRLRADTSTEEARRLTCDLEQHARERAALVAEHRDTLARHRRRLDDFAIEHETLKAELERLRHENSWLKSESARMSAENEEMRHHVDNGSELSRLTTENESLKDELENLRCAHAKANREAEVAITEREKLCREIHELRNEKSRAARLLEKMQTACEVSSEDSRKIEKQLEALQLENAELRRRLEDARSDVASRDDRTNALEAEMTGLKSTIGELAQRHRAETEEMRSRHASLVEEMSSLNREDSALRDEVNTLRSVIKRVNDENAKIRTKLGRAEDELAALKAELARVRAENEMLKTQYDATRTTSCRLESENAALKDKLEELRRFRITDAEGQKQLRRDYEKLKLHNVALESKLTDARRKIGEYAVATSNLNGLEDRLKSVLKDYETTKKTLHSRNQELVHLRRAANPYATSPKYSEDIQAT